MNIITIDPSLISTGLTVNGVPHSIAVERISINKNGSLKKWFKMVSNVATIHHITESHNKTDCYSKQEVDKHNNASKIARLIRCQIDSNTIVGKTLVVIEGYSYASTSGPIIDLVTLGTLIRNMAIGDRDTRLVVLAPTTLKSLAARLTYPSIQKGKRVIKYEYRNNEGVAGGKFTKHDMFKVLIENDNIQTPWVSMLRENQHEIFSCKNIPKPIEDINDAVIMHHVINQHQKSTIEETVSFLENL